MWQKIIWTEILKSIEGQVPLYIAAEENHLDIAKILLDSQADPDIQDLDGKWKEEREREKEEK